MVFLQVQFYPEGQQVGRKIKINSRRHPVHFQPLTLPNGQVGTHIHLDGVKQ